MRRLVVSSALLLLAPACGGGPGDNAEASEVGLTAAQCRTPEVTTRPLRDNGGNDVPGTAHSSLEGCIVGEQLVDRAEALFADTNRFGRLENADGHPVFTRFEAGPVAGTLESGLTQEIDVTLAMDHAPKARIRVVRKRTERGTYSLTLVNVTPFKARVVFFDVTAIETGKLTLEMTMKPEPNGVTVIGKGSVKLEVQQESAAEASGLVKDLFEWLKSEVD